MRTINTTAGRLRPGDTITSPGVSDPLIVEGVQRLGSLVIVDLTDGTSTAPMPAAAPVRVRRAA